MENFIFCAVFHNIYWPKSVRKVYSLSLYIQIGKKILETQNLTRADNFRKLSGNDP